MEAKWIQKIITVGTSQAVILPKKLLSQLPWGKGDTVVISYIGGDKISVELLHSYLESLPPDKRQVVKLR